MSQLSLAIDEICSQYNILYKTEIDKTTDIIENMPESYTRYDKWFADGYNDTDVTCEIAYPATIHLNDLVKCCHELNHIAPYAFVTRSLEDLILNLKKERRCGIAIYC